MEQHTLICFDATGHDPLDDRKYAEVCVPCLKALMTRLRALETQVATLLKLNE
jgi:hypothetical protein